MKTDKYSNPILTINEAKRALLYGNNIEGAIIDDSADVKKYCINSKRVLGYNSGVHGYGFDDLDLSVEEYHAYLTKEWDIPKTYKEINVLNYLLDKCLIDKERERVLLEYDMFEQKKLIPLLQFLIFIVDYMRENEIVWGVGRGSSVASYCLYLIGIHRVNSLKYNLDIKEFLKE